MVKIYQDEELNDITFGIETLEEWKRIAEELGMVKQLDLVRGKGSPIPYPHINLGMDRIFSTLCPTVVDYKSYSVTPIPLEVMKQILFSVRENHFTRIEIWADNKKPDPFAIGIVENYYVYDSNYHRMTGEDDVEMSFVDKDQAKFFAESVGYDYKGISANPPTKYLIARWADELRDISELKEIAKERLIEKFAGELKTEIEEKTQALKLIKENAIAYLNGDINEAQIKGSRW